MLKAKKRGTEMSAFTLTLIHNHASKKYLTNFFHFQKTTICVFKTIVLWQK